MARETVGQIEIAAARLLVRWFVCDYQGQSWQSQLPSRQVEAAREVLKRATLGQAKGCVKAIEDGRMPSLEWQPRKVTSLSYLLQAAPAEYGSSSTRTLIDEYVERYRAYQYKTRPEIVAATQAYEADYFAP